MAEIKCVLLWSNPLTSQGSQLVPVLSVLGSCRAPVDLGSAQFAGRGSAGRRAVPSLLGADAVPQAGALCTPALTHHPLIHPTMIHPPEDRRMGSQHRGRSWEGTQADALGLKKKTLITSEDTMIRMSSSMCNINIQIHEQQQRAFDRSI